MQIWTKALSTTLFSLVDDHNENLNDILLISLDSMKIFMRNYGNIIYFL